MSVPSNLIPFTITQLPIDPSPSVTGILMYVRNGVTYQVTAEDIVSVTGVPLTRQVLAGTGLTGGGQLTDNVTLSVAVGGIGTVQLAATGVTPGVYGTATAIPVLTIDATGRVTAATTVPSTTSGYVPTSREIIAGTGLNGGGPLTGNVTLNANLSNAVPLAVDTTGSAGSSNNISRADHQHPAIDLSDDNQVDNILGLDNGGTGRSIAATPGAVIYSGADGLYLTSPGGGVGDLLQSNGTAAPSFISPSALSVSSADDINGGAANRVLYQAGVGDTSFVITPSVADTFLKWDGSGFVWGAIAGAGTVTSVDGSGGITGLTVTGGPITSAGVLTLGGTLAINAGGTGLGDTPTNGQLLIGDGAGFKLSTITAGTGITVANATGSITIANSIPDQTITLSDGTAIAVTGTYPSFTITNTAPDQTVTVSAGTNISVSGTYPSFTVSSPDTVVGPAGSTGNAIALFDDGTGKLLKNSPVTISSTGVISGVATPDVGTDAANKTYVDNLVSTGLTYHDPVQLTTTSAFAGYSITYNNGSSGVSATITQASSYSSLTIDSTAAAVNNRILVKDATNAAYNGVYYVNSTGSAITPWVMTRTSDADTYGPAVGQLSKNDYFFTQNGVANKGAAFVCTTSGTISFGTTDITFAEFSVSQVYSAGTGLTLSGTTFSLQTPVSVLNGGTGLSSAATNGQLPIGDGSGFTLSTLTAGTGVSVANGVGSITITNTAPDQTVVLSGSGAISVTGTYPNFTLYAPISAGGTVTSVDGSSTVSGFTLSGGPITTSGRLTLAGTLAITAGGTGASTQAGARTALGLGTISTQDASSVSITGGSIGSSVLVYLNNATGTISGGTY